MENDSYGFWRRVHLIPFPRKFSGKDKDATLREKLLAEAPGILTWAVMGCLSWQGEGLGAPSAVAKATSDYQMESDVIGQFVGDCCFTGPEHSVKVSELRQRYQHWANGNGNSHNGGWSNVAAWLEQHGCEPDRFGKNRERVWRGIALAPEEHTGPPTPLIAEVEAM